MTANEFSLDRFTEELFQTLYGMPKDTAAPTGPAVDIAGVTNELAALSERALSQSLTQPILALFDRLKTLRAQTGLTPDHFGLDRNKLLSLAQHHQETDEHGVSVGGRLNRARPIVDAASARVQRYLDAKREQAPSGIELWDQIQANQARIQKILGMDADTWNSYSGQIKHRITNVKTLSEIINLPATAIADIGRVTEHYRMRLTPYYAGLIQPQDPQDPVLVQSVPTAEMVDNVGTEIPPVAADHSPARLIDQFYPQVVTIKATNMCAMYCTHCLRIAHIGKKDQIYNEEAYGEALDYISNNPMIRDVLITGGDALVLPNALIDKILNRLDEIDHVRMKRLGTRIPVTAPQRVDSELLDIIAQSNDRKPLRVVTQINTALEITPVSREAFKNISRCASAVLNQAVLLKGINDSPTKMRKLCETIQESYVRPYYIFNCSYRNPQFAHLRVPIETGRDIVEGMYGNISGDAIPRYIATAGGKIPLHRDNVGHGKDKDGCVGLKKPWNDEVVAYPDADPATYADTNYAFERYAK